MKKGDGMSLKEHVHGPVDEEFLRQMREAEHLQENCPDKHRHTYDDPEVAEDGCPTCAWGAK